MTTLIIIILIIIFMEPRMSDFHKKDILKSHKHFKDINMYFYDFEVFEVVF